MSVLLSIAYVKSAGLLPAKPITRTRKKRRRPAVSEPKSAAQPGDRLGANQMAASRVFDNRGNSNQTALEQEGFAARKKIFPL
jgi:hypothetical protein